MKNIALIPARSESKRIKHKNIKLIAGHPLIYYQINCAKQVKDIDKIIVATDNNLYATIAKSLGVDVIIRPPDISTDTSKTEDVMLFTIKELEKNGEFYDNIILLQATSPLNKPEYIKNGLLKMSENQELMSIGTYSECNRFRLDDPELITRPMTQDKIPYKIETGCFWITNIDAFKKVKNRLCEPYDFVKVDKLASLDIDDEVDLTVVESLCEKRINVVENKYFKKRICNANWEKYWGEKPDPDGKIRNLLSEEERQKKIKLFKNEINFINNISIQPNTKPKLLDLGCGPGFLSSAIRNEFEKYGLEVSKNIADFAKKYIKNVHIGPLTNDTYPEEFFDIILCSHVIEHIEDPFDFIKNIRTILKTHGYLVIGTPNFNSGAAIRFGENYRLLHDRTHISLFDDFGLNNFLEDFGFYIEKIDYPFFDTEYFTMENFERLFDTSKMSPSFYGNLMTFYTQKK